MQTKERAEMKKEKTLLSYSRDVNGIETVDLDDNEVKQFVSDLCLDNIDHNTFYNILSMIYHSEDVEVTNGICAKESPVAKRRYFCDTTICFSCGEMGHEVNKCSKTSGDVCGLCGSEGHARLHCPYMLCSACGRSGHRTSCCKEKKDPDRMRMCRTCPTGMHSTAECPRIWRRYKCRDKAVRRNVYKSCPRCLSKTHFIDDCNTSVSRSSVFTSSFLRFLGPPGME